jgi:hypothetical protein
MHRLQVQQVGLQVLLQLRGLLLGKLGLPADGTVIGGQALPADALLRQGVPVGGHGQVGVGQHGQQGLADADVVGGAVVVQLLVPLLHHAALPGGVVGGWVGGLVG